MTILLVALAILLAFTLGLLAGRTSSERDFILHFNWTPDEWHALTGEYPSMDWLKWERRGQTWGERVDAWVDRLAEVMR